MELVIGCCAASDAQGAQFVAIKPGNDAFADPVHPHWAPLYANKGKNVRPAM